MLQRDPRHLCGPNNIRKQWKKWFKILYVEDVGPWHTDGLFLLTVLGISLMYKCA